MRGPIRSVLLAALAACAFGVLTVGSASAATMEDEATAMLAIYGNPGSNGAAIPVGGGLGRNFGFGKNMLFQACEGCTTAIGKNLKITLENATKTVSEAKDSYIGGTLMSNKTGANNPLSFTIDFADFQFNTVAGSAVPSYADTTDREWIAELCSPASTTCKTEPSFTGPAGEVQISDVSFDLGPGVVVQGTVWGVWKNSPKAGEPPCIKLNNPPTGAPATSTLYETQGTEVGVKVEKTEGEACLISANNDWYIVGGTSKTPAITLANT
jgi:hypothetical protein